MKKTPLIALFAACSILVFSCNKDEAVKPENEASDKFSELSVEENKAKMEENGLDMIREMEELKSVSAIETSLNLARLLTYFGEGDASTGGRMINSLRDMQAGSGSVKEVFSAMRMQGEFPTEEPQSIQDFFDIYAGTYTWAAAKEEWSYTEGGSDVTFKFPSKESGSANNAVFRMGNYQGTNKANPIDESYSGDLPTSLKMDMSVDGNKVMDYSFAATYNDAGEPSSLDVTLALGPFTFAIQQSYNAQAANVTYSLKNEEKLLMAFGADTKGNNFDSENLDNVDDPSKVVEEISAYFQLMNIKVAGMVDAKNLMAGLNQIDFENDQEATSKALDIYTEHYKLQVYYADSKLKIADTEFYSYTTTDPWSGEEYEEIDIRLVFADGSKSDLENYFETGFDGLAGELQAFFESLEE